MSPLIPLIDQIQNPLQRGFTEAIPMLFAAFIASEVIIESSTNNDELFVNFPFTTGIIAYEV
jgi:hypothetical protein